MSDLPFNRRDFLGTGITVLGATRFVQSVDAQNSGRTGDPTDIRDWNDLDAVRQDLDGNYRVVNDLDQTTAGYDEHVGNPEAGWNPIGHVNRSAVEFTSFTGTIDGNGHTITGLQINRPEETDIGLFAMIANRPTTVTDLTLTELDVTGREFVCGIVGTNVSGTVARSEVTGEVTGETFVGGVVGKNSGDIRKSSFRGTVSGAESVGGLVGWNVEGASVRESWSRGEVTGDGIVGGLVGTMTDDGGTVRESWSSTTVTGGYDAGGLVGYNKDSEGDPAGEVIDSYWNTDVAGQADAVGNNEGTVTGVTGLSTDKMTGDMARETMGALDFEATWQVVTAPDGYPVLQWQQPTANVEDPPETEGFDPAVHGFGFTNWSGTGQFTPAHDHQTIAEETFRTQFNAEWLPVIAEAYPSPLPDSVIRLLISPLYETLRNGPESIYSDGHCYGMCLVAQEYFEAGVSDSLPADVETAADIEKPTGDYAASGREIDDEHRSQALNGTTVFQINHRLIEAAPIDATAEVRAIQAAITDQGTAIVGIGTDPSARDQQFAHQLIAYDVELTGGDSVSDADSARIDVYDPNEAAAYYTDDSRQLEIDLSGPSVQPLTNNDGAGYQFVYDRFGLVGPSRTDFLGAINFGYRLVRDLFDNYLDGLMTITAHSPVRIDATAPDGRQLEHPEQPVEDTPPSELVYLTETTSGEYEVQIEGTADGAYTLDILGSVPDGGVIEERFTHTISEGETQTVIADLPTDPEQGTLTQTPSESDRGTSTEDDIENPFETPGGSDQQDTPEDSIGKPGVPGQPGTPTRSASPTRTTEETARESASEPTTDATDTTADTEATAADGPGFGIVSTLASLGGAGYLLRNRLTDDDHDT